MTAAAELPYVHPALVDELEPMIDTAIELCARAIVDAQENMHMRDVRGIEASHEDHERISRSLREAIFTLRQAKGVCETERKP